MVVKYINTLRPAKLAAVPNARPRPAVTDREIAAAISRITKMSGNVERKVSFPDQYEGDYVGDMGYDSVHPNIYGRCSIFDCCQTGDIFGLQVVTFGLMQWIGWRSNRFYQRRVGFIPWYGPEGTVGGIASSGANAPCDMPEGWEYGVCGYNLYHTAWYGRAGDALDPLTIVQDRCETTPRYRVNGQMIADDMEWQMNGIMNVLQMDVRRGLIHGSHANGRQMDGLEALIKTGYVNDDGTACPQIDSILVDWGKDNLDGENNNLGNYFEYLDEVVTEIEYRAKDLGGISETDMILLTSRFMATCLLDSYACYSICGVTEDTNITDQALRAQARETRRSLNGGPLYDGNNAVGYIMLKSGRRVPIIVDDYMDITRPVDDYCTDTFLLTRKIGSLDVLYGEYLDMTVWENRVKNVFPNMTARADAAGRFVVKGLEDLFCVKMILGTSPEIYLSAPWAQVRISDVCCSRKRKPLTGDLMQPEYLPGGAPLHTVGMLYECEDLDDQYPSGGPT